MRETSTSLRRCPLLATAEEDIISEQSCLIEKKMAKFQSSERHGWFSAIKSKVGEIIMRNGRVTVESQMQLSYRQDK
jgi:hypothetical protein